MMLDRQIKDLLERELGHLIRIIHEEHAEERDKETK
jgi:hypothetical protein